MPTIDICEKIIGMISQAIHATYDKQSFHITNSIDIQPNNECVTYVQEIQIKKPADATDYLFSIAETPNGPPDQL